jgi:acyl carrier protein
MKHDEFYGAIAAEFELDKSLADHSLLESDLGFDSLGMFDLVLFIEEVAGVQPEDQRAMDYPMMTTLGDAYAYCEALEAQFSTHGRAARNG